jgi:hypothetical protein
MKTLTPVLYRIKPEQKQKVKKHADKRSKELGEKVSESAVIRSLIETNL